MHKNPKKNYQLKLFIETNFKLLMSTKRKLFGMENFIFFVNEILQKYENERKNKKFPTIKNFFPPKLQTEQNLWK